MTNQNVAGQPIRVLLSAHLISIKRKWIKALGHVISQASSLGISLPNSGGSMFLHYTLSQ
jgi:hypothetical protein